jgi:hypothetical protein
VTDAKQRKSAQSIEGVFRVRHVIPGGSPESIFATFKLIHISGETFGVDPLRKTMIMLLSLKPMCWAHQDLD